MAGPIDIDTRRYWRVAVQRKIESRTILEKVDLPKAAVYLAGYAVECALKAVLIEHTPRGDRPTLIAGFRGAAGHDLHRLATRLRQIGVRPPADIARNLLFVSDWTTDLRYEPGPGHREDAQAFIDSVDAVVLWAGSRI